MNGLFYYLLGILVGICLGVLLSFAAYLSSTRDAKATHD